LATAVHESRNHRLHLVAVAAIAAVLVGVFSTWTSAGPVTLNGTEGPNNGWLVVILAGVALAWARLMRRDTWTGAIGAVGVLGAATVICWTAIENWLDNRETLEASVGHGLLLVVAGAVALAVAAVLRGVELVRWARG
jgi:ABC-type Co2+ transport system permease subunit